MHSFIESCFKSHISTRWNSTITNERVPTATQCKSRSWIKLKESHLDSPLEVLVIQNHDFYDTLYLYITLVPYSCISSADFLEKYTRTLNIRLGHQDCTKRPHCNRASIYKQLSMSHYYEDNNQLTTAKDSCFVTVFRCQQQLANERARRLASQGVSGCWGCVRTFWRFIRLGRKECRYRV